MTENKKPLLLQISVPFCVKRCSYCAYPYCTYDPRVVRAYGKALLDEIAGYEGEYPDYEVQAISIEGGSPCLLGADALSEALRLVKRTFVCAEDVQISLQTMPGDYSRALMERMRDAGVNFWIVGLQTAQAAEHEVLERPYRFDAVTMVDTAIRTFHPRALSFDLLAGIAGQSRDSLEQSLKKCLYYAPEHMTIYPLQQSGGDSRMAEFAAAYLQEHGFIRYTLYDFGRDGCVNRFRLLKLQGCEYLGLGYHGASFVDGVMWHNGHSLQEYLDHASEFDVIAADVVKPNEESLKRMREENEKMLVK